MAESTRQQQQQQQEQEKNALRASQTETPRRARSHTNLADVEARSAAAMEVDRPTASSLGKLHRCELFLSSVFI